MNTRVRGVCAAVVLFAARGWAASPSGTQADAPVKETLGRMPEPAPLDGQVRELEKTVRELEKSVEALREREALRENPPGGPDDHPLWP